MQQFFFFLLHDPFVVVISLCSREKEDYFVFSVPSTCALTFHPSCWTFSQFHIFTFSYLFVLLLFLTVVSYVYFCNTPDHVQDYTLCTLCISIICMYNANHTCTMIVENVVLFDISYLLMYNKYKHMFSLLDSSTNFYHHKDMFLIK